MFDTLFTSWTGLSLTVHNLFDNIKDRQIGLLPCQFASWLQFRMGLVNPERVQSSPATVAKLEPFSVSKPTYVQPDRSKIHLNWMYDEVALKG